MPYGAQGMVYGYPRMVYPSDGRGQGLAQASPAAMPQAQMAQMARGTGTGTSIAASPKRKGKGQQSSKLKPIKSVPVDEWRRDLQLAAKKAFDRLETRTDPQLILARIERGAGEDVAARQSLPCYYVERASTSPFQLEVAGSRILAHKVVYCAYHHIEAKDMGTWQVSQRCLHNDNDWWCFEPSHLVKCEKDHVPANTEKHPMPKSKPDAYYVIRGQAAATVLDSSDASDPATDEGSPRIARGGHGGVQDPVFRSRFNGR